MASLFEKYVAEEQKKGIKSLAKLCRKFNQSHETARDSALEEYPDVDEGIIDEIIDEVYGLVK